MFPAWDPTALRLVAPMKGIANLRSQPPHRGILRISPTNILLTLIEILKIYIFMLVITIKLLICPHLFHPRKGN